MTNPTTRITGPVTNLNGTREHNFGYVETVTNSRGTAFVAYPRAGRPPAEFKTMDAAAKYTRNE